MSKFIMAFITTIWDLPRSVYRILAPGLMSLGHYFHYGKWKHCKENEFTMEMREHHTIMGPNETFKAFKNRFWLSHNVSRTKQFIRAYCSATHGLCYCDLNISHYAAPSFLCDALFCLN